MKKWLPLALLLLLPLSGSAPGGVPCTLPFNIQNGQPADATQVMANYNALVSCLTRAAAAGVNSDITALTALTTPIPVSGGGTPVFVGGTSTGAANVQVLATTTPPFIATVGFQVTFTAGFTNTGPLTLQVGGSAALPVFRRTQLGISATVGGEVITGQRVVIVYDGVQYQLQSDTVAIVGALIDYSGSIAPAGWAFLDGSCQLRTGIWADLFAVIGTTYDPTGSTCDVAHFALPDARGRVLVARDTLGTRLTTAGTGCNGAALGGAGCGVQNFTLAQNQLPNVGLSASGSYSGGASINTLGSITTGGNTFLGVSSAAGATSVQAGAGVNVYNTTNFQAADAISATGSSSGTFSGSTSSLSGGVAQQVISNIQPLLVVNKIIKL